jgi:hypothetical protein
MKSEQVEGRESGVKRGEQQVYTLRANVAYPCDPHVSTLSYPYLGVGACLETSGNMRQINAGRGWLFGSSRKRWGPRSGICADTFVYIHNNRCLHPQQLFVKRWVM